ncbi:MAG: ribbon-helix-helix protein, CopG family [Actinomycetota bacterium]
MRLHIHIDDDVVEQLDERVGPRGRSAYVERALREALDRDQRWGLIRSAYGSIDDAGHDWDDDPAAWVRAQRRADPRRVG